MNKGFRSLADRIVDSLFEASPFFATQMGIHQYDHLLDRYDAEARAARRSLARDSLKELKAYENASLTQTEQIDLAVLQGVLQVQLRYETDLKMLDRNATIYVDRLLEALYTMVVREYAPPEERATALLERLRGVPAYVQTASQNLKSGYDIPAVWTEIAIESLDGADLFFKETLQPFAKKTAKGNEEFLDAAEGARRTLLRFKAFLRDEILPRCDGSFAVGRDMFEFLLEKEHGLSLRVKDLLAIGEEAVATTRAEIARTAAEIAPGKAVEKLLADAKKHHPALEKLTQTYKKEMERARDFVVKKDLLTVPDGEKLVVTETPPFARGVCPYAAYMPPAPFDDDQTGLFWVTPVQKGASAEKRQEQLEGHSLASIPVTAIHEAYPGHHLQLLHSNRASSKVRKVFGTSTFWEGWALYCEELMFDEGFYSDPKVRLMQLKDQLWRAHRVLIDLKLHLQQMSMEEAVDVLVDGAWLERANAIAEVKRYTLTPTQPMSYLVGKREILALRDDYKHQRGERFKLKEFHDKLLSFGSIPLPLAREAMLR